MTQHTDRDSPRGLSGEFRKLWAASALSNLGDGVVFIAAPLLAAALTHDPRLVAGLAFAQRLPWLLFALLSGTLVDRLDRRRTMAVVTATRASLIGALGVTVALGIARLPLLYGIFFLLGTGETLFDIAAVTIVPAIVRRDVLPEANARLAGALTVTDQFLSKPLGGVLFAMAAALPFLMGAGGLALAAAFILLLRGTFRVARVATDSVPNLRAEIAAGIRWLWRHRLLRTIGLSLALLDITLVAQNAVMVLYAEERLGVRAAGYGLLIATYGAGGVAGSLVAHRVIRLLGSGATLRIAMCIEAAVPAALALSRSALLAGATLAFFGFHAIVWGALLTALRQELTPAGLRGRVESAYRFIDIGGATPGALLGGVIATRFGITAPFWLGAIVGTILIPFVWSSFSDASVAAARRDAEQEASASRYA